MKARRVVIQLECETVEPVAVLRRTRMLELFESEDQFPACSLILTKPPRVTVIPARKPAARKGASVKT